MRTDRERGSVKLEIEVIYDGAGAWFIEEQDGPNVLKYGPLPYVCVEAYIASRATELRRRLNFVVSMSRAQSKLKCLA